VEFGIWNLEFGIWNLEFGERPKTGKRGGRARGCGKRVFPVFPFFQIYFRLAPAGLGFLN